jgi:hypothetical protein
MTLPLPIVGLTLDGAATLGANAAAPVPVPATPGAFASVLAQVMQPIAVPLMGPVPVALPVPAPDASTDSSPSVIDPSRAKLKSAARSATPVSADGEPVVQAPMPDTREGTRGEPQRPSEDGPRSQPIDWTAPPVQMEALTFPTATLFSAPIALAVPVALPVGPAPSTTPNDTSVPSSTERVDLRGLVPEFRGRLERLIDRMKSEYGYDVEVVETVRSQERQNSLFAQGRTSPGPVVTWTRASNHLTGRAADLVIDGSYDNPVAYARLAMIARQEGLRTLGPRDAGHVELPRGVSERTSVADATAARPKAAPQAQPTATTVRTEVVPRDLTSVGIDRLVSSNLPAPSAERETVASPAAASQLRRAPERPVADANTSAPARTKEPLTAPTAPQARVAQAPAPNVADQAPQLVGGVARVAEVARVAQVAPVAQVAQVARVAQVATVGETTTARRTSRSARAEKQETLTAVASSEPTPLQSTKSRVVTAVAQATRPRATTSEATSQRTNEPAAAFEQNEESVAVAGAQDSMMATPLVERPTPQMGRDALATTSGIVDPGSEMTERIARAMQLQETLDSRSVTSVLLRLDSAEGGEDRVRIDLRGDVIGATLDVRDPAAAERLSSHVSELRQSLEQHGLETDLLTIKTATRQADSVLGSAVAAAERELTRSTGTTSNGTTTSQRDGRTPQREEPRQDQDPNRSRQRREARGGH